MREYVAAATDPPSHPIFIVCMFGWSRTTTGAQEYDTAAMKRVTRAVRPQDLHDLLERPPRATLAFVGAGAVQLAPVAFQYENGHYFVGLPPDVEPPAGRVKLLVDDGRWYFDLRGFWVRGTLAACQAPAGAKDGSAWFELIPQKTVAWHYGSMREP